MVKRSSLLFKLYKLTLSPIFFQLLGAGCRFTPTCSHYARESIEKYGMVKGASLALKRLSKCHPLARVDSFFDPVPDVPAN